MEAYKIAINGDNEIKLWVDPCSLLRSGETAIPKYTGEWTLGDDYALKVEMLKEAYINNLHKMTNGKYGVLSIIAIQKTRTPDGKTVFTVLGNNKEAIIEILISINSSMYHIASTAYLMNIVFYMAYKDPDHLHYWVQAPTTEFKWITTLYRIPAEYDFDGDVHTVSCSDDGRKPPRGPLDDLLNLISHLRENAPNWFPDWTGVV